jgi:hypothetical protein
METFETPMPIRASVDLGIADLVVTAADTTTTTVDIRPARPGRRADVEAAEAVTARLVGGRLEVRGPKPRFFGLLGRPGGVIVGITVPTGSDVDATCALGDLEVAGAVQQCRLKTFAGDVRVDDAEALEAQTAAGDISVHRAGTSAELQTSAGAVTIGEVAGAVRAKSSAGDISVGRSAGDLVATSPYAQIRVREAVSGSLTLTTSYGDIEVGVPEGTAARLDVETGHGRIRNDLTSTDGPPGDLDLLTVVARTSYGQIAIRRP